MSNKLIAVESIDGAGGTTVANALADELDCHLTSEPFERRTREHLEQHAELMKPVEQLFTFLSDRAFHQQSIEQCLDTNHVICDRYMLSTAAYQGPKVAGQLDISTESSVAWIQDMHNGWCRYPDLTVYINVDPRTVSNRLGGDTFEDRKTQEAADSVYLEQAARRLDFDIIGVSGYKEEDEMIDEAVTKVMERL